MSQRKKKRAHHRAFVVTFAVAASACGGAESTTTQGGGQSAGSGGGTTTTTVDRSLLGVSDTLRRVGETCEIHEGIEGCPPDARCNPPAPRVVVCPPSLSSPGAITRQADGACVLRLDPVCVEGPMPTCNPPPPRRVPCNTQAVESGLQARQADGQCYEHVLVNCPRPSQQCTQPPQAAVDCPEADPT